MRPILAANAAHALYDCRIVSTTGDDRREVKEKAWPATQARLVSCDMANDAVVQPDGKWEIMYRHPTSGFGHDKSQAILPYRALPNPPTIFFFGDGVSGTSS